MRPVPKDQMDDHSLWEILNFLRHKAGGAQKPSRLRTSSGWINDPPQTMVRGFLHDMVTKGEPVSQAPLIRGGEHAEWLVRNR